MVGRRRSQRGEDIRVGISLGRRLPLPQRRREPLRRAAAAASGLGQVYGKLIQVIGGQRRCPRHDLEHELGQVTGRLRLPQHSGESAKRLDDRTGHDHRRSIRLPGEAGLAAAPAARASPANTSVITATGRISVRRTRATIARASAAGAPRRW